MYKITPYSYKQAEKIGVDIRPSHNPNKKIDIYINGNFIGSIGAAGYYDYPTYIIKFGKKYADQRRKLYKIRHNKTRKIKNSMSWFADKILW